MFRPPGKRIYPNLEIYSSNSKHTSPLDKFSGSAPDNKIQIYVNDYKCASDLWWRVWGWWFGSCSQSPPHSVCKGCTARWTDEEWFLHTLCKHRTSAATISDFYYIIYKTFWTFLFYFIFRISSSYLIFSFAFSKLSATK